MKTEAQIGEKSLMEYINSNVAKQSLRNVMLNHIKIEGYIQDTLCLGINICEERYPLLRSYIDDVMEEFLCVHS